MSGLVVPSASETPVALSGAPVGRVARLIRVGALVMCPPVLAYAYDLYCANILYGIVLAYAPILFGCIGLIARPVLDAAADRANPRYEFSGKGAILGSCVSFFPALVFAPQQVDRTALVALFLASSAFYYALGKIGCLFLGCCRAIVPARLPLPAIEAACSLGWSLVALGTLPEMPAFRLLTFAAVAVGFLALRVYSRCARGSRARDALGQPDSIALGALACCAAAMTPALR